MKKDTYKIDNYLYIPASLDVGNYQTKAVVSQQDWLSDSVISIEPIGHFDSDQQPGYFASDSMPSFVVGQTAFRQENKVVIGDNPKVNKAFANPYFAIASLVDCIPKILGTGKTIVRPFVLASLQDASLEAETRAEFDKLPDSIQVVRFGKQFTIDLAYLKEHIQFRQEGHAIARLCASSHGTKEPVLLIDFGGRTIHATNNDKKGFSENDTTTSDEGGALALFDGLLADGSLDKCFSQDLELNANIVAGMVVLGKNQKLVRVVSKEIVFWLSRETNKLLWEKMEMALESDRVVVIAGGASGLPGFRKGFEKLLRKLGLARHLSNVVFAEDVLKCEAYKANARSLYVGSAAKLRKILG